MKLPKKLLRRKHSEKDLIAILEYFQSKKAKAIQEQNYEYAAELRDQERKYREQLEDLMNPPTESENNTSEEQS